MRLPIEAPTRGPGLGKARRGSPRLLAEQALRNPLTTIGLAVLLGCSRPAEVARATVPPPSALTIFYTCDTRGHVEPCACASGKAGGLARRQTYLTEHRAGSWLLVDAGDVTAGAQAWELVEFEYLLKGYERMGYHAVNAGQREASIPLSKLKDLKAHYPRFISANLLDEAGQAVFAPFTIVALAAGYRVGILGVLDDRLNPADLGTGLKIAPPADAIARHLPELKKQTDLLVLLAFADEERMQELAERFFEIDVIIGGKVRQPSGTPVTVNNTLIAYNTDKGKALGRLELTSDPVTGQFLPANDIIRLMADIPDDPGMAELVREYRRRLKELDIDPEHHRDDEEGLSSINGSGDGELTESPAHE